VTIIRCLAIDVGAADGPRGKRGRSGLEPDVTKIRWDAAAVNDIGRIRPPSPGAAAAAEHCASTAPGLWLCHVEMTPGFAERAAEVRKKATFKDRRWLLFVSASNHPRRKQPTYHCQSVHARSGGEELWRATSFAGQGDVVPSVTSPEPARLARRRLFECHTYHPLGPTFKVDGAERNSSALPARGRCSRRSQSCSLMRALGGTPVSTTDRRQEDGKKKKYDMSNALMPPASRDLEIPPPARTVYPTSCSRRLVAGLALKTANLASQYPPKTPAPWWAPLLKVSRFPPFIPPVSPCGGLALYILLLILTSEDKILAIPSSIISSRRAYARTVRRSVIPRREVIDLTSSVIKLRAHYGGRPRPPPSARFYLAVALAPIRRPAPNVAEIVVFLVRPIATGGNAARNDGAGRTLYILYTTKNIPQDGSRHPSLRQPLSAPRSRRAGNCYRGIR